MVRLAVPPKRIGTERGIRCNAARHAFAVFRRNRPAPAAALPVCPPRPRPERPPRGDQRFLAGALRVFLAEAPTSANGGSMRKIIESTLVSADGVVGSPAIWPTQTDDFAQRVNEIRKYVFSSTLERADWSNSTIVRGDVVNEVTKIKEQDGADIAIFGHGQLAQTLLEHGLTEEVRLSYHPVLAGTGLAQFRNGSKRPLTLVSVKSFRTGVVTLSYQTNGAGHD